MEDYESCSSRASETSPAHSSRQQRQKVEVYNVVLRRLKEFNNEEANQPGFEEELWNHFNRLPARYIYFFGFLVLIRFDLNFEDLGSI